MEVDQKEAAMGSSDSSPPGSINASLTQPSMRNADGTHERQVVAAWNDFDKRHGRFADDWNGDFVPDGEPG